MLDQVSHGSGGINMKKQFDKQVQWLIRGLLFIAISIQASLVKAAEDDAIVKAPLTGGDSFSAMSMANFLNMTMGLIVVLVLIFGLAWVLKKYGRLPSSNLADMKILGGLSLGTREKALLIEVENTRLLIGVTPGQIQTLHVLGAADNKTPFDETLQQARQQANDSQVTDATRGE